MICSMGRNISLRSGIRIMVIGMIAVSLVFGMSCKSPATTAPPVATTPTTTTPSAMTTPPVTTTPPIVTTPPTPQTFKVDISLSAFIPERLTIAAGSTVTWTNFDPVIHTITSDDGFFGSGPLWDNPDHTQHFSYTFNEPGVFAYHCTSHPSEQAVIIVE